jgi:hypothetical protein
LGAVSLSSYLRIYIAATMYVVTVMNQRANRRPSDYERRWRLIFSFSAIL